MAPSQILRTLYENQLKLHGLWKLIDVEQVRLEAEKIAKELDESAKGEGFPDPTPDDFVEQALLSHGPAGFLQQDLDNLSSRIEAALKEAKVKLEFDVYVGLFPTGSFNAQAMRFGSAGVLILVNTGLMMLIHQFVKILTFAIRFTDYDAEGKVVVVGDPDRPAGYTQEEIIDALTDVVVAYLRFKDTEGSQRARRFPAQADSRGWIARWLVFYCELFAVAHEYAHAVDGHLHKRRTILKTSPVGPLELVEKEWNQEFVADALGVNLMLRQFGTLHEAPPEGELEAFQRRWELYSIAAAPLIFFALDDLITEAQKVLGETTGAMQSDHPSATDRAASVRKYVSDYLGGDEIFELADTILALMSFMSGAVIARLRDRKPVMTPT